MKKLTAIIMAAFFLAAFTLGISAQAKDYDKMGLDEKVFCKAKFLLMNEKEIGLSSKQVKEIKDIKVRTKKFLIDKCAEIDKVKVDIKSELYEDKIDTGKVDKLIDSKYDLKKEKAKYLVSAYVMLKNTLNADQMKTAKDLWIEESKQSRYMGMGKARMMGKGKGMKG